MLITFGKFSTLTETYYNALTMINTDTASVWNTCLKEIELEVSKANFSTWFRHTSLVKEDAGIITVGVPNEFVRDWLLNKYNKLITKVLLNALENNVRGVEYVIVKHDMKPKTDENGGLSMMSTPSRELPLADLYINKEDNLNPRYTFDSFIVGPFNELGYAAAQAIIARPGQSYNPFFIYGNTGLGKTHLIQAIGNTIKIKHPAKKVHYITLEKFAMDYINAVHNNKANTFKEKYRKYDVLIIDDIQFISKMEKTQEELFHLFNAFYENGKQIVFSSDKHPNYITGLEARLHSRFSQGMIVDISEPDFESRVAILRAKAANHQNFITPEIISAIAESVEGNIRELEGSLNSVVCHAELKGRVPSIADVKNLLKNNVRPKKNVSVAEVVKIVAGFYSIEENLIYDKTRRKEIVKARQMIMYILREMFNVSYPLIGQKLGGKDHTTVIHSCEKIKNDLKHDPTIVSELEQLKIMFK